MQLKPTTMQRAAGYADALLEIAQREVSEEIAAHAAAIMLASLAKSPEQAAELLAEVYKARAKVAP